MHTAMGVNDSGSGQRSMIPSPQAIASWVPSASNRTSTAGAAERVAQIIRSDCASSTRTIAGASAPGCRTSLPRTTRSPVLSSAFGG
jgi:hypothetical protein